MIQEAYCSFEVAKLLKEKGFNEICRKFYKCWPTTPKLYCCDNSQMFDYCTNSLLSRFNYIGDEMNIAAPTHQMVMTWLREVHNIFIEISVDEMLKDEGYQWALYYNDTKEIRPYSGWGNSYEEAVEAAIKYCLEYLI